MNHRTLLFPLCAVLIGANVPFAYPALAADDTPGELPTSEIIWTTADIIFSTETLDSALLTTFEEEAVLTVLNGDVNFEVDSDQLTPRAREVLDGLAAEWSKAAPSKVTIVGHTDSVADDAYNLDLSKRRAASVGQYLSSKVAGLQITTDGKGESQPIADNNTEEGKAQNRRVEIRAEK